jgi:hypothetical protein
VYKKRIFLPKNSTKWEKERQTAKKFRLMGLKSEKKLLKIDKNVIFENKKSSRKEASHKDLSGKDISRKEISGS